MLVDNPALFDAILFAQGGMANFTKSIFFPLLLMFVVMYLLFFGPEKRRRAEQDQMQKDLKKNDVVITIGGIIGTVVSTSTDNQEVTIRIDDNSRMKILRNAIASKRTDDKKDE